MSNARIDAPNDLVELVRGAVARGAAPFFTVAERALPGAEFAARVAAMAAELQGAGVQAGERVAVLVERSAEEAIAILGATVAGAIAVPINGKLKDAQIRHVIEDCRPTVVVTSHVRLLALRDPAGTLTGSRLLRCHADELGNGLASARLTATAADVQPDPAGPSAFESPLAGAPAVLLYTSGSTGLSKGVIQTHGNLAYGAAVVADYLALTPADHLLTVLPLSFDYGLNQLLSALFVGCRFTGADHLGVGELSHLLQRVRPTGLAGVPWLWHEVARALESGVLTANHGASLRYVTSTGGVLRREDSALLRARWPNVAIYSMYGLTEAFRSACLDPAEFDRHPESFGRAIPGVELLLVDPDTGDLIEGEGVGELVHAGALVAAGYWERPEQTAARFRPDPRPGRAGERVVYSGDLVRRDAAGRHTFVARRDRMIKVQGYRISPDEIAAAFADAPGTPAVVAFGRDCGAAGQEIVLVAAGDARDGDLVRRLRQHARSRLPGYMQPTVVHVVETMPTNPNGKVDEGALRRMIEPCTDDR